MGIIDGLQKLIGGNLVQDVRSIINDHWPPELSPEKRAELDLELAKLDNETRAQALSQLHEELADVQNARLNNRLSSMPAQIFYILSIFMAAIIYVIVKVELPTGSREIAFNLFGNVQAAWLGSIAYWVGTTRSSAVKTTLIAQSDAIK